MAGVTWRRRTVKRFCELCVTLACAISTDNRTLSTKNSIRQPFHFFEPCPSHHAYQTVQTVQSKEKPVPIHMSDKHITEWVSKKDWGMRHKTLKLELIQCSFNARFGKLAGCECGLRKSVHRNRNKPLYAKAQQAMFRHQRGVIMVRKTKNSGLVQRLAQCN